MLNCLFFWLFGLFGFLLISPFFNFFFFSVYIFLDAGKKDLLVGGCECGTCGPTIDILADEPIYWLELGERRGEEGEPFPRERIGVN